MIRAPRGRLSTMLSVNGDMMTFAVDLRPDRAILAIVDLSGRFISRETLPAAADAARTVLQLGRRMCALREEFLGRSFEGIGISIPGRVHPNTQHATRAAGPQH